MYKASPSKTMPTIKFEHLNWVATTPLPRDVAQSTRLHEPEFRTITTDPMTDNVIEDFQSHPSLVDGNLTIYFDSEATRKEYVDLPLNHPNRCLPFAATDEDDRGG